MVNPKEPSAGVYREKPSAGVNREKPSAGVNKEKPSAGVNKEVQQIHIIGAGRMGQGIALSFIFAGVPAVLIDLKQRSNQERDDYFAQIKYDINKELQALSTLGLVDQGELDAIMERLTCLDKTTAEPELANSKLVFEGVPEVMALKQETFEWLDRFITQDTVVASTTSTFLVTDLAKSISKPERFLNAHWLNPAHLMPLVEVSCDDNTSEYAKQTVTGLLKRIGKVPVVCSASAGYIVPRLQALAMSEAARMVDEGVASAQDIDNAVRVGFGLRFAVLGLLEFIDWGGGDILYYASNYLAEELDERFRSPQVIEDNMKSGRNGLREGQGFYDYRDIDVDEYKQRRTNDFAGLLRAVNLAPKYNRALLDGEADV